jgi:hypothetical protein
MTDQFYIVRNLFTDALIEAFRKADYDCLRSFRAISVILFPFLMGLPAGGRVICHAVIVTKRTDIFQTRAIQNPLGT